LTLRTAWKVDCFDFCRPDEARMQAAETTNDDESAPTSGPSGDARHVHVAALANLASDQPSTHEPAVHNTSVNVLNDDKGASQRIEQHRTTDGGKDWSFSSVIHSGTRSNEDDQRSSTVKQADDAHAWKGHGRDHHWNSDRQDASKHGASDVEPSLAQFSFGSAANARGHGDSFHFKDKISVFEVSNHGNADHGWAPVGNHGQDARGGEPPTFAEPTQHHWSDNFNSGPDHAWSAAHSHGSHHDLMV